MKYIAYEDSKAFMKDLKRVYGAESEEIVFRNLEAMKIVGRSIVRSLKTGR